MLRLAARRSALLLFCGLSATAQIAPPFPGQGPFPGDDPSGIPMPFPRGRSGKTPSSTETVQPPIEANGILRKLDEKSLTVEAKDGRVFLFRITAKTKYSRNDKAAAWDDLQSGEEVAVESHRGKEGDYLADAVTILKSGPEQAVIVRKAGEESDKEAPRLRRGKPPKRETPADSDATVAGAQPMGSAPSAPPPDRGGVSRPPSRPPLLQKAFDAARDLDEALPNFLCNQMTSRYDNADNRKEWTFRDQVTAKIVYRDGKETYEDLKVNNRAVKDDSKTGGMWSSGEFGVVLRDLFDAGTRTEFTPGPDAVTSNVETRVFDFAVARENSHWQIKPDSQYYFPPYRGSMWVEKSTGHVLRLEMGAQELPKEFPVDHAELAVDFQYVAIGARKFLLPVRAESMMCERGSPDCQRNVIEFRNYRRFGSESSVTFDK